MSDLEPDRFPAVAVGKRWEELPAGTRYATESRTITEAALVAFIGLSGYTEPLFFDERESRALGYNGGRLVPAALTYITAEGLVLQTNYLHRTGIALLSVEFTAQRPVFVGTTIRVLVEVSESRAAKRSGRGVVTSQHHVVDADDLELLSYQAVRLMKGQHEESG